MSDFKLKADLVLSKIEISQAVRNQLKNIKVNIQAPNLSQINKSLQQLNAASSKAASALNNANNQLNKVQKTSSQAAPKVRDMSEFFAEIGRKALAFRVAATLINTFTNAISDSVTFLRELDQTLADVKKISGQTDAQLASLGSNLIEIASKYGQVAEEVAAKYKTIIQAGFDAEKSLVIVDNATKGAAATTLDFAQATDLVIQSYKVFGELEANKIFDKVASAESSAAVTATDMQEAIKRSAGTFKTVNASVDEMIGLVSALQEVGQRGGAVVGTAFKTIIPRLYAGETRKAVEELGVSVADQEGKLKPLMQVLSDLGIRFKSLTEEQRIYYAKTIAGVRQIESFIQILDSLDKAQLVTAKSINSAGEAEKRAAIQAETLNGRLNTLRNTFLEVVRGVQDFAPLVDIFKGMTTALTGFLKAGDGAVAKMTALAAILVGFKSLMPLFKGLGKFLSGGKGLLGGAASISALGGFMSQKRPSTGFYNQYTGKIQQSSYDEARTGGFYGNKYTATYGPGFGNLAAKKTKEPISFENRVDKFKQKTGKAIGSFVKDAAKMSTALFGAGIALSALSSNLDGVSKDIAETGGTLLTAFAFGPIIGSATVLASTLPKVFKAIDLNVKATSAYERSLNEFGSVTLANMSKALVEAKASGDEYAATVIAQDIAYQEALLKLQKGESSQKLMNVAKNVEGFIKQMEELGSTTEITMKELQDKLVSALTQSGYGEDVAKKLVTIPSAFKDIFSQINLYTNEFRGLSVDTIEELLNAMNDVRSQFKEKSLVPDLSNILGNKDVLSAQTDLINSLKEVALAEEIYNNGITDSIELKRKQANLEYETAKASMAQYKNTFNATLDEFTKIEDFAGKINFDDLKKVFENASTVRLDKGKLTNDLVAEAKKLNIGEALAKSLMNVNFSGFFDLISSKTDKYKGMYALSIDELLNKMNEKIKKHKVPELNEIVSGIENIMAKAGVTTDKLDEKVAKLFSDFLESEKAVPELDKKTWEKYLKDRELNYEAQAKQIDMLSESRNREIDQVEKLRSILEGTKFEGQINTKQVESNFSELQNIIENGIDTKKLTDFYDLASKQTPLEEAKQNIQDYISSVENEIDANRQRNELLNEMLKKYQSAEPTEERNIKIQEIKNKILENTNELDQIRAKTLKDVSEKTKSLKTEEKKAYDELVKVNDDLSESMNSLIQTINDASIKEYEDAHSDLERAQQDVIKSTEDLADAYQDLKEAQLALGDAIADYRVGVNLAAREADIITGRIKGFSEQLRSVQDVYDEVLNTTRMTEVQKLELIKESASKQLEIVQNVVEETKSIGQRLFTADAAEGTSIVRGFAAIRDIMNQFQGQGGFGGIDLNEFGNQLLQLPQSLREEISKAISYLPETATLGGFSKKEIEDVLYGSAVGQSQEANIQNIKDLTTMQVDLLTKIAEYNSTGIISANAQLEEARKQYDAAEAQLSLDEIMLDRQEENFSEVANEIKEASALINSVQADTSALLANTFNESLFSVNKENLAQRAGEHLDRLSVLKDIDINTKSFADALKAYSEKAIPTGFAGHIPNLARGNVGEIGALIKAYNIEKKMAPAGSRPVIANDSEYIIPTKAKGNIPHFQGGNVNFGSMEDLLGQILDQLRSDNINKTNPTQTIEANINVNGEQKVNLTGASSIADAVAKAMKSQLGDFVTNDQMAVVNGQIVEFFDVLRKRGLVNVFGKG